ncbi:MAG TPA: hypothetical protein VF553_15130 [Pyrinomonadaceae bacterium]|jgi:hypothetical protein
MHASRAAQAAHGRRGERGGTRLRFLIVIIILAAIAYCGYQFIPFAYQAYQFKDYMQQTVDKAVGLGQNVAWVEMQLTEGGKQYGMPPNAEVKAGMRDGRMEARVRFTRPVALPFYTYQYEFDNTVKSSDLFVPK